jgi:uncharacterized protein (TIGR03083 family)
MVITNPVAFTKQEKLAALEAERRDILELYRNLAPEEWQKMTLCTLWTVRDMLAHLISNDNPFWAVIISGFNADKANQRLIEGMRHLTNEQLIEKWASVIKPKGAVAAAPDAYLADDWVHNQDVRWPLNRPRQQNPTTLKMVLNALLKYNRKRVAGLHLVATDLDWEAGTTGQPEIRGTAEALAMGIANRPVARQKLNGDGVGQLFV